MKWLALGAVVAMAMVAPEAQAKPAAKAARPTAELSAVVRGLMQDAKAPQLSYEDLVPVLGHLQRPDMADYSQNPPQFVGKISMHVNGKAYADDRVTGDDQWEIVVDGPQVGPESISFVPPSSVRTDPAGIAYFTKAGIHLAPMACEWIDPGNYNQYLTASAPGKQPATIEISVSTGSGGAFYSYTVFWNPPAVSDLTPGATLGACPAQP